MLNLCATHVFCLRAEKVAAHAQTGSAGLPGRGPGGNWQILGLSWGLAFVPDAATLAAPKGKRMLCCGPLAKGRAAFGKQAQAACMLTGDQRLAGGDCCLSGGSMFVWADIVSKAQRFHDKIQLEMVGVKSKKPSAPSPSGALPPVWTVTRMEQCGERWRCQRHVLPIAD